MRMKRNAAVVAGLAAVLALSPVAGPAVTAFAAGGADAAVEESAEKVTVTFDFGEGYDVRTQVVNVGGTAKYPWPYPENADYKIEGWYYDKDFTHKWYSNDKFTEDTTLYAKWVDRYCTVTFWNETSYEDMTGAVPYLTQEVESGKTFPRPGDPPAKEGYKFEGWYSDKECTKRYNFSAVKGDLDVYAKWTKFPVVEYYLSPESEEPFYTVRVDLTLGGDAQNAPLKLSEVLKHLNVEIPEGYEFNSWYTDPGYTEKYRPSGITEDTKVYLKFNKQPVVTYDFQLDGVDDQTVNVNLGDYADPATYEREGYEIENWYTDAACTNAYDFTKPVMGDVTLYAKWQVKQVSVTFDDGIAGNTDAVETVDYGQAVAAPADPAREGYDFAGWYTDADCTAPYDFNTPVTGDLTLYAKWVEVEQPGTDPDEPGTDPEDPVAETHKVTFDDCLASTQNPVVEVKDGETVAKPADPTCKGYTFLGWYSDTALTQAWDFSAPVTKDMTLWAKWEKDATDPATTDDPATTPSDPAEKNDESESALPKTGDVTLAVSGIAAVGSALAGAGALLRRRR